MAKDEWLKRRRDRQRKKIGTTDEQLRHNIGQRVRYYRGATSQRAYAESVGITQAYLCRIENGTVDVSVTVLRKIAFHELAPLSDFFTGIETSHKTGHEYGYDGPSAAEMRAEEKERAKAEAEYEAKLKAERDAKYGGMTDDEIDAAQDAEFEAKEKRTREYWDERKRREDAVRQEHLRVAKEKYEEERKHITESRKARAIKAHPDAGGTHEAMRDINEYTASALKRAEDAYKERVEDIKDALVMIDESGLVSVRTRYR